MNDKWIWDRLIPRTPAAAGNFSKQFKNLQLKAPGIMALDEPSPDAVLLAREVIQNSWDSAAELRDNENDAGREAPDFEIEFVFKTLTGADADHLANAVGLHEHQARVEQVGDGSGGKLVGRNDLGLGMSDCLDDATEIKTLTIVERGTAGMHGSWDDCTSKMFLALMSVGITQKHAGAGGSFGFGKAGLIRGSRIRTVLAYSCFRERATDPGVTRRLLGATYWGPHEIGSVKFTGFGLFGNPIDFSAEPFENEEADRIAGELGLDLRDPGNVDELGTTFLLIDSDLDPLELCSAIERSWWPALEDDSFEATVIDPTGERLHPRPKSRPDLLPFVRAHELATTRLDSKTDHEFKRKFQRLTDSEGNDHDLGTVGIVADTEDWSYPGGDHLTLEHRSLIALVRGPKMVVEYLECGGNVPFVRGTFVADDSIDELLRQTEPPLHDAWDDHDSPDVGDVPTEIARAVKKRIKTAVIDFRNQIRPPVPDKRDLQLDLLEELMGQLFDGKGNKAAAPPRSEPRDVSIHFASLNLVPSDTDPTKVRYTGKASVALTEHVDEAEAPVAVVIRYKFVEDGAAGEPCFVDISPTPSFKADADVDGRFIGLLTHDPVSFEFQTTDYDSDWSGKLSVDAGLVKDSQ